MGDLLCVGRSRGCERPQPKKRIQCQLARSESLNQPSVSLVEM